MAKISLILSVFIISIVSFAQEKTSKPGISQTREIKSSIRGQLELATVNKATNLLGQIKDINQNLTQYSEIKKSECDGDFTVLHIGSEGEEKLEKEKLSKEEKKKCYADLINFRKEVVQELYKLRRKLLVQNHQTHLYLLEQLKSESLIELEKLSKQYQLK